MMSYFFIYGIDPEEKFVRENNKTGSGIRIFFKDTFVKG